MKKVLIFVLVICLVLDVYALPQGENVISGGASFDRSQQDTLDINVTTDKLIVEYQAFSIAGDEAVHFHQPSSNSVVLNRVVGADPSSIIGTLTATGKIFLINPNGVLFGKGCRVDTAGLVASTLDISNEDFLNEKYFFRGASGEVINEGNIFVPGGYVALLGETVENSGSIEAELGSIMFASGKALTLSLDPQGIISVVVDEQTAQNLKNKEDAVKNTGEITACGGKVILTAKALGGIFERAVNNEGIIRVDSLIQKHGDVVLEANQRVRLGGEISAGKGMVNLNCQGADFLGNINASKGIFTMNDNDTTLAGGTYNGDMSWQDNRHITVTGDITVNNGSVTITADADGDSKGNFTQSLGIITTTSTSIGDIIVSGVNLTVKDIASAKGIDLDADRDVTVDGDLSSSGGGLSITANADGDNQGDFKQDSGSIITTSNTLGDVSISGKDVTMISVNSAKSVSVIAFDKITVDGNIASDGSLTMTANADGDNQGDFKQDSGDITTNSLTLGDVSIDGRQVTTGRISSAKGVIIGGERDVNIDGDIAAFGGIIITSDEDVTVESVSGTDVTITAAGVITDGNAGVNNITAANLVMTAAGGIGSGNALETAITNLQATNTASGDIEISNTGSLTAQSVVNQAGDISLTTSLDLTVSGEVNSVVGGVSLISSGGAIAVSGAGPHLKAADDSFIKAQTTAGTSSDAFDVLVTGGDATVTLTGDVNTDRGFFTGTTPSDTLVVENTSSGVIYFNDTQIWPIPTPTSVSTSVSPVTTTNSDVMPHLVSALTRKFERGYLELSDSLVIFSADQSSPHSYRSHLPPSIDASLINNAMSFGKNSEFRKGSL